jgi:hypothetical protein
MTGKHSAVVAQIKEVAPDAKFVHCSIHREALTARKMPVILKTVLTEAVEVVNFIKSRATNSRLFSILRNEMGSEHDKLLLHTKVRGNVLSRLSELRSEVRIFLSDTTSDLSNRFTDEMWFSRIAYVADIFCRLNELNKSLQGFRTTPFSVHDKTKAFRKILGFIIKEVESGQMSSFPFLDSFISEKRNLTEP